MARSTEGFARRHDIHPWPSSIPIGQWYQVDNSARFVAHDPTHQPNCRIPLILETSSLPQLWRRAVGHGVTPLPPFRARRNGCQVRDRRQCQPWPMVASRPDPERWWKSGRRGACRPLRRNASRPLLPLVLDGFNNPLNGNFYLCIGKNSSVQQLAAGTFNVRRK